MKKQTFEAITKWQNETFPTSTAASRIAHLRDEINELDTAVSLESFVKNDDPSRDMRLELADCFTLLFGVASSLGFTFSEIDDIVIEKFEINKARTWGEPDERGVVNHVDIDDVLCKSCDTFIQETGSLYCAACNHKFPF